MSTDPLPGVPREPNRGYFTPDPGSKDWHQPLNFNAEMMGEDVAPAVVTESLGTNEAWPSDTPQPLPLTVDVPMSGQYLVVARVEVGTAGMVTKSYAAINVTVDGGKSDGHSGSIGPEQRGPDFEDVRAVFPIPGLMAGQTIGLTFLQSASIGNIPVTSNTSLTAMRVAPLEREV